MNTLNRTIIFCLASILSLAFSSCEKSDNSSELVAYNGDQGNI